MAVLLQSGVSVYRVAVAADAAVKNLETTINYLAVTDSPLPPTTRGSIAWPTLPSFYSKANEMHQFLNFILFYSILFYFILLYFVLFLFFFCFGFLLFYFVLFYFISK
jgi:hypothetical protein